MSMEFTLNDLQRQRVEDHLALVEQVLRRSIKTNETVDGMGHDDLYQEGCIALCRASVSYREEMGAFPAYARTVIRNYLLDRCREIQSARKNLPLLSLDAFAEMGAPEPVSPFHTEDLISDVSSDALLSHFRNRYHGTARLGIEAMELRVRGYSCADIAKLYQKKPNYIGACISRAAEKLRRERIVREFYTACTEQDIKSAYWDAQNHAYIHLNPLQSHDVNLTLQKRYAFLQWEQGSGKTPAAIFTGKHRVEMGAVHSIWVISSAISIRNNWDVILKGAGFSYVFVERLADLQRIRPGDFVILTLNKVSQYKKQIGRYIKQLAYKIQFIFDESDNISNPSSKQTLSVLSCFRRCKYKLLTTGTSTRNNISEFAPQLELLYNNSINMISWCRTLYSYDKRSADMEHKENPYYAMPIPAYKKGYRLFANSHLPEKITVFGVGQRNQDIYNADELDRLLGKTVITRTFEEVTGKDIRRIHQMPIPFLPEEREVYNIVLKEFYRIQREYYSSTGNSRKDALMRLIQQITLLLRISAAPDCMKEYEGETPLKEMAVVEALARWPEEVVAIGVRHTTVLDRYAAAIREYLPDRPLFVVTGSTVTFAKRRALRDILRDSQNGILLCTQQSLPSSVNFEFVNKIIIPEMHYNNAGMSQFYMRFVRYTSTEKKDLYFPIYIGSLESNLMQMVLAKEKLTMFMKGQDADMDEIYAKFGVDYDLLSTLMTRETDDEGHLRIHWGEQKIA